MSFFAVVVVVVVVAAAVVVVVVVVVVELTISFIQTNLHLLWTKIVGYSHIVRAAKHRQSAVSGLPARLLLRHANLSLHHVILVYYGTFVARSLGLM